MPMLKTIVSILRGRSGPARQMLIDVLEFIEATTATANGNGGARKTTIPVLTRVRAIWQINLL